MSKRLLKTIAVASTIIFTFFGRIETTVAVTWRNALDDMDKWNARVVSLNHMRNHLGLRDSDLPDRDHDYREYIQQAGMEHCTQCRTEFEITNRTYPCERVDASLRLPIPETPRRQPIQSMPLLSVPISPGTFPSEESSTCYCGARFKKDNIYVNYEDGDHYGSVGPRLCIGPTCEYRDNKLETTQWTYCPSCIDCIAEPLGPARLNHPMRQQYQEVNFFANFLPCNCTQACLKLVPSFVWHTLYDASCLLTTCLCNSRYEPADKNLYE